jgi:LysM repeat protein
MPRTIKLLTTLTMGLLVLLALSLPLTAQTTNLLVNPSFEQGGEFASYQASLGDPEFNFAQGWGGWFTQTPRVESWQNIKPFAYPHPGSLKVSGNFSQDIARGGGTFTAAAFQIVNNIPEGTKLQATVKVYLNNGTDTGAKVRIGLGSNVGGDPTSGVIVWSAWMTTVNQWQQISVETTVPAGSVTVFVYGTQDRPNGPTGPNHLYMDDAGLFVTGAGTPSVPTGANGTITVPIPPTSAPAFAAFASAQGNIENGKVVHVVVSGDTLAAIAVAYGVPIKTLQELNGIPGGIIFPGQKLIIKDAPTPTPAPTTRPANTPVSGNANVQPTRTTSSSGFSQPTRSASATAVSGNATVVAVVPSNTPTPTNTTAPATTVAPSATALPATTQAPTQEVAVVENTQVVAQVATDSQPTIPPSTPTNAPTAPVAQGQSGDPLATTASVCVLMFDDVNQNRIQNSGENLLAGGVITLRQGTTDISSYQTNGTSEPFCFEELAVGTYTAVATVPQGYGLTTPPSLVVSVQAGTSFKIVFGAAQGVAVAVVPTANAQANSTQEPLNTATTPTTNGIELGSIAGILLIGLAGVVLVGGVVVYFIARRL